MFKVFHKREEIMKNKWNIVLFIVVLLLAAIACGSTEVQTDTEEPVAEDAEQEIASEPEEESGDTAEEPTKAPTKVPPTETPEIEGLVKVGTHLVGSDIDPGIFVGQAGDNMLDSCYWARLSGLSGSMDELIANDNAVGLFYVEVLEGDEAFETACEVAPIDQIPSRDSYLTSFPAGTYLVGRDISPGTYVGEAGTDMLDSCYWARLGGVSGDMAELLGNDNALGLFYVEVLESDYAFRAACDMTIIEEIPARDEFLTSLEPGTYIIGRDIEAGRYRGEAGSDFLDSCYWSRLSGVSGEMNELLANDNATGQYFIEVSTTDYALSTNCPLEKVE
jgi:hypothetical protein